MAADTIDCDIHPGVPDIKTLLPYMNEFWQESFVARGIDGFDMMSYPLNAPITCRADWRVEGQRPGASLDAMRSQALETFDIATAICNPLTGGQVAVSESWGPPSALRSTTGSGNTGSTRNRACALPSLCQPRRPCWQRKKSTVAPATAVLSKS